MSPRGRSVATTLAVVLLFALPLLPEIVGSRRLVFRDAHITHWPWRRYAMAALDSGRVPFVNAGASGGEPLLSNPNAVLLYPTVLLERVLPSSSAFNLHYLLGIVWAFLGARLLAARLGVSPGGAVFSGAAYAFSGAMLSFGSAFANSGPAAAWLPWCAAAAVGVARARDGRETARSGAAAGLAFGLQLLAGEPAISLLTAAFAAFVAILAVFPDAPAREKTSGDMTARLGRLAAGGVIAAVLGAAFAAALLLPLRQVLPLTYRGQHLYSESAFGAASFRLARVAEWFFPSFQGDPSRISGRAGALAGPDQEFVYIWCVTLGVLPLFVLAAAALRRQFWDRSTTALAAAGLVAWLFSFGLSLPFSRLLFSVELLRRLRYPVKFYLLATAAFALLAGFAADRLRGTRFPRRQAVLFAAALLLYVVAAVAAHPDGWLESALGASIPPGAFAPRETASNLLASIRGDAVVGAAAVFLAAAICAARRPAQPGFALALATAALALPWGLPLFVTAGAKDLARPPAILASLKGEGRLFVSPKVPAPAPGALDPSRPGLPRYEKFARVLTELLIPDTGETFGVSYLFDHDPDGSYGWYNRLAAEASAASTPLERSRLLRAFGARWALTGEAESVPLFRPVTGVAVGGRNLVLHVLDDPVAPVRFAAREHRRASLSAAIALVRSEAFSPETEVVLPGRTDRDAPPAGPAAAPAPALALSELSPERIAGELDAPAPGHVVFARTYFPAWRARVDGAPARVLVANARDVAVAVPAGRHVFEIAWDRRPFHRGVIAQAAALAAALGVAIATARRKAAGDGLTR